MNRRPDTDADAEAARRRVESPCVGVCVIDEASGLCEGCLRTLEEVAVWGGSDEAQRRAILERVTVRRAAATSLNVNPRG